MNATSTPRIVTVCAPRRPIACPKKPAAMAPTSGASGTARSMEVDSCADMAVSVGVSP